MDMDVLAVHRVESPEGRVQEGHTCHFHTIMLESGARNKWKICLVVQREEKVAVQRFLGKLESNKPMEQI
jgi:hypothetical protein